MPRTMLKCAEQNFNLIVATTETTECCLFFILCLSLVFLTFMPVATTTTAVHRDRLALTSNTRWYSPRGQMVFTNLPYWMEKRATSCLYNHENMTHPGKLTYFLHILVAIIH